MRKMNLRTISTTCLIGLVEDLPTMLPLALSAKERSLLIKKTLAIRKKIKKMHLGYYPKTNLKQ